LIGDKLSIDAGALTSQLTLADQVKLDTVLVSHSHLDHVRDLAMIADNRAQRQCAPLRIAGTKETIDSLKKHFFNNVLWPDFAAIPDTSSPTITYQEIPLETPTDLLGYEVTAVAVHHTVDCAGFIIDDGNGAVGISGDTGPTDRFWELLNQRHNLKALLMEVSFPDREQKLATASGHHTPATLLTDLHKYKAPKDLATMLYHIKPPFQSEVEKECAKLKGLNLHVLNLLDEFVL